METIAILKKALLVYVIFRCGFYVKRVGCAADTTYLGTVPVLVLERTEIAKSVLFLYSPSTTTGFSEAGVVTK